MVDFQAIVSCVGSVTHPLLIDCGTPAPGIVGTPFSHTVVSFGGIPPKTFSDVGGWLPAWATLNPNTGEITGTPDASGTPSGTIRVTDSNSDTADCVLSLTIVDALAITTTTLPNATVGSPYSETLAATGGQLPYAWRIASGSLPAGLSLNSSTGEISGTATVSGTSNFTAEVTDASLQSDTQALSIETTLIAPIFARDYTTSSLGADATFARNSAGTYVGTDGLIKTAAINEPRFEANSGIVQGLLMEPAATNICYDNRDYNAPAWSTIAVISAAPGIDGVSRNIEVTRPSNQNLTQDYPSSSGQTVIIGYYKKKVSASDDARLVSTITGTGGVGQGVTIDCVNGTIANLTAPDASSIEEFGDWWKVGIEVTLDSNPTHRLYISPGVGETTVIDAIQVYQGVSLAVAMSLSPIFTAGAPVSRDQDTLSYPSPATPNDLATCVDGSVIEEDDWDGVVDWDGVIKWIYVFNDGERPAGLDCSYTP